MKRYKAAKKRGKYRNLKCTCGQLSSTQRCSCGTAGCGNCSSACPAHRTKA